MFIFEKIINLQGTTINLTHAVVIGRIVTGGLGQEREINSMILERF